MPQLPNVAVIGAGSSGITALKALLDAGLTATAYEKGDRVGGNWVFRNSNGMSSSYRSLHINTSRARMEFADYPMPPSYPDFPHHTHIAEYFQAYTDHFGLAEHIRFSTGVAAAQRNEGGGWTLTLDDGTTVGHDALVVANGHHWDPRWPEPAFPGEFSGRQMHAHHFEDNTDFAGQRVVVVGMGNSAMDIAVESSFVAERTFLSARRGVHILPKYVAGRPLDQINTAAMNRLPWRVRQAINTAFLRLAVGSMSAYGLPEPDHGVMQAHPTISDGILSRIAHGEVTPKPAIAALEGEQVRFTDGSVERVDIIVYATGYKISFPFFAPEFLSAPDNELPLYRRVFHPDVPDLFFIGLCQPLGAIMPLAEQQGRLVAAHLRGRLLLPPRAQMDRVMAAERRALARRYVASRRHTIQVDFEIYLEQLRAELRAGTERARAAGFPLPVPARPVTV